MHGSSTCYSVGIHALAAVIFWGSGQLIRVEEQMRSLLELLPSCLSQESADEILYGKAGYLFCLLFVHKNISKELCERMGVQKVQRQVFDAIIQSGKRKSGLAHPQTG